MTDTKEGASKAALLRYLEEGDVILKHLIDTGLDLFVPHLGVETKTWLLKSLRKSSWALCQT